MSIKGRIRGLQVVVIAAIATMAAATYVGISNTNYQLERMQLSRQQLDAMTRLAVHTNRFSEQIAELMLIGDAERDDFDNARAETEMAFAALRQFGLQEIDFVRSDAEKEKERQELARIDQMYTLFREIGRAAERVWLLDRQGRRDDAIAMLRSEIENGLDAELEGLVKAAVSAENAEVAKADGEAKQLSRWLMAATLILCGVLFVIALGSGFLFARSLQVPIRALTDGAVAIGRGELNHRIRYSKPDEFGQLAGHFNEMGDELQRQREALLAAQSNLERQVAERTREIGEANAQLTELDRQRVRLLTDISHELRTPLTVLRGEAEVTLRGASKPEGTYRAALATIVTQAADMSRLVDDLLFLARSEADEIRFEFRRVALANVVSEAIEEATVLAHDRQIRIAVDSAEPSPTVRADPRRLKQALLIVLDNAAKYAAPQTGINVRVSASNNGSAQICVRDQGPGISPDDIPHVFDRFYRGDNATERGGSGLGLPIARWIVEKHEGSIDLSSTPGGGTEVRIALPSG
jgi:two-component system OmpR family sensor kinase